MNEDSVETRYGAVRAYWTLNKDDPFIVGENLNDQFDLRVLRTTGEPLVHLTRSHHAEIVVFGDDQQFQPPLSLSAGKHILINAKTGDDKVIISRFEVGKPDERREVSLRVADVIRAVTELNASYPDVAQMLSQADAQFNLPGRLEVDALPQAGRYYSRPLPGSESASASSRRRGKRIGTNQALPNMYPALRDARGKIIQEDSESEDSEEDSLTEKSGEASVSDARSEETVQKEKKDSKSKGLF